MMRVWTNCFEAQCAIELPGREHRGQCVKAHTPIADFPGVVYGSNHSLSCDSPPPVIWAHMGAFQFANVFSKFSPACATRGLPAVETRI